MNHRDYQHFQDSLDEFVFWSVNGEEGVGNWNYQELEKELMDSIGGFESFANFLKTIRPPPNDIFRLIDLVFDPSKIKLKKDYRTKASINIEHNITIREELTIEEKIKAILHELFHMYPSHFAYTITDMDYGMGFFGHNYRRLEAEA